MEASNNSQFPVETEQRANEKDRLHTLFVPVIKRVKLRATLQVRSRGY